MIGRFPLTGSRAANLLRQVAAEAKRPEPQPVVLHAFMPVDGERDGETKMRSHTKPVHHKCHSVTNGAKESYPMSMGLPMGVVQDILLLVQDHFVAPEAFP